MSEMLLGGPPGGGADPLAALLGGGAGAPLPGPEPAPPAEPSGGGEIDQLKQLLGLSERYMKLPTVTEVERAEMMKSMGILQKLLAQNEKMEDQAMGGSTAMRKALAPRG